MLDQQFTPHVEMVSCESGATIAGWVSVPRMELDSQNAFPFSEGILILRSDLYSQSGFIYSACFPIPEVVPIPKHGPTFSARGCILGAGFHSRTGEPYREQNNTRARAPHLHPTPTPTVNSRSKSKACHVQRTRAETHCKTRRPAPTCIWPIA